MEPPDIFTSLGPRMWVFAQRSGTDSSRGLNTAGIQYKFICIKHSDKEKCGGTRILAICTMRLNCLRTEDVCSRALHRQSLTWVEFSIWRKGVARWEEQDGLLQSCFSVWETEKFGWIVLFSHDLPCPSLTALSQWDSCGECSFLPEKSQLLLMYRHSSSAVH